MHWKRWYRYGDPNHREIVRHNIRVKGTSEHTIWAAIKNRCNNPNEPAYKDYGARGIVICDRWLGIDGFDNFLQDMGKRPLGMTIERINNDRGYQPDNCKWATMKEQCNNRRSSKYYTITGVTKTLAQWADDSPVKYRTIWQRINGLGWSIEKALRKAGQFYG